jgi:hypothetical protein
MADKSLTKKELKAIAEELNKVAKLDDEDYIDPKQDSKKLQKELEEVVGGNEPQLDIYPEDNFSDEGWKILEKLGSKVAAERNLNVEEEPEEPEEAEESEEEAEETEEEETEEEAEEIDYDALSDEIEETKKVADLKKIAKENEDTFAALDFKEFKKASELKQAMLDEINKIAPRAEDEESEEEAEEEKDFADEYTTKDIEKLKKKGVLELIEEYDLDVDTEKSVKEMKQEIIEKYLEEEEPEPEPEPKKSKKSENESGSKKSNRDFSKSNKAIVWKAWDKDKNLSIEKLLEKVDNNVKEQTIKNWINQWKKGNNLPAVAKNK